MTNPQVPEELKEELAQMLVQRRNFEPYNVSEKPSDAPDHIENYYDMFAEGLDDIIAAHTEMVRNDSLTPLQHLQVGVLAFAFSPLGFADVAAMFSVALDRMVRAKLAHDGITETNDSVE